MLRFFEGKATEFEVIGNQPLVGLSMHVANLVTACGH